MPQQHLTLRTDPLLRTRLFQSGQAGRHHQIEGRRLLGDRGHKDRWVRALLCTPPGSCDHCGRATYSQGARGGDPRALRALVGEF